MFLPNEPQFYEGPKYRYPVMWSGDKAVDPDRRPWSFATKGSLYMYIPTATWYRKVADNKDANDWVDALSLANITDLDDWPTTPDARYYTQTQIDAAGYYASPYIESLGGGGLIANGSGFYGDNTNFSDFTFDPLVANASLGSFRHDGSYTQKVSDLSFPVTPGLAYRLAGDIRVTNNNTKTQFLGLVFYDADGNEIQALHHMFDNGTLAQLTRDFTPGTDTHIYIDDDTGWSFGTVTHHRGFIFWDYVDGNGFEYPPNTYSRHHLRGITPSSAAVADIGGGEFEIDTNTSGYTTGDNGSTDVFPAGTYVSRMSSGAAFKYIAANNVSVPTDDEWHNYSGYIGGLDVTGSNKSTSIPQGARTAKIIILSNYSGSSASDVKVWFANLDFRVAPEVNLVEDGSVVTTGALGTIDYYRGFRPTATSSGVISTTVIS